jgi:hypothetical protein
VAWNGHAPAPGGDLHEEDGHVRTQVQADVRLTAQRFGALDLNGSTPCPKIGLGRRRRSLGLHEAKALLDRLR